MSADLSVDSCGDLDGLADAWFSLEPDESTLWNGREIRSLEKQQEVHHWHVFTQKTFAENCSLCNRSIEQIELVGEEEKTLETFLLEEDYEFDTSQTNTQECKSFMGHLKRVGKECKKGVKKAGKGVEKVAKKTAKVTKKVVQETVDFVKDHAKECAIAAAIIVVAVTTGVIIAGAPNTNAPTRKDDDDPDQVDGIAPSDPPRENETDHSFAQEEPWIPASDENEPPQFLEASSADFEMAARSAPETGSLTNSSSSKSASFVPAPLRSALSYLSGLVGGATHLFSEKPAPLEPDRSRYFVVEGPRDKGTCVTFINGMNNTFEEATERARYIQKLGGDQRIDGIYNHSNGKAVDIMEVFGCNYNGYSPVTQNLLAEKWTEFHEANRDNTAAKCLHICHSQGAIHTKNALMRLPEEIRNRVIVIAIAPGTIVPQNLCFDSFNYASKNDIVHLGEDLVAQISASFNESDHDELLHTLHKHKDQLILLEPHEEATGMDHGILSPTYESKIEDHLREYIKHNGEYK